MLHIYQHLWSVSIYKYNILIAILSKILSLFNFSTFHGSLEINCYSLDRGLKIDISLDLTAFTRRKRNNSLRAILNKAGIVFLGMSSVILPLQALLFITLIDLI